VNTKCKGDSLGNPEKKLIAPASIKTVWLRDLILSQQVKRTRYVPAVAHVTLLSPVWGKLSNSAHQQQDSQFEHSNCNLNTEKQLLIP
jgi:hypothetical protein